jgi:pectinesterase
MLAAAAAALALLSPAAAGERKADIVVAQDGTGDFTTVQDAIDAAPDYEHDYYTLILVKEGTYR